MKEFLKYTLATVIGMVIFAIVIGIISVISLMGMVASQDASTVVKEKSVFVLPLSGMMDERASDNPFGSMIGQAGESLGLDNALAAIKKAKQNENIKGIYIEAGIFSPDSYASCQALRKALVDFKKSGKWIVAYADQYTQASYYICSVADEVLLNPNGMVDWHGLAAQPMFYKDLLAKIGVKMQIVRVGTYKSAVEPFTEDHMSDANREQTSAYITGIWNTIVGDVAASRKLSVAKLNEYADNLVTFAEAKSYVSMNLVDKLVYTDEVKGIIKKRLGIDKDEDINQLSLSDMINIPRKNKSDNEIAVYYAYGEVVNTSAGQTDACISGVDVSRDLEDLMNDDDVKAVVLRVNSGGGSAYASEQIWNAVTKLKAKKPIVVSMGGMAASGGYYLSCAANYIIAEPTTLTGSIGIFGMFPDVSELTTQKLGLKFDVVKTNKMSDFGTLSRPLTADENAILQNYVNSGYALFTKRVADGRKMTVEQVDKIGQGRVWLGKDALKLKLVDKLGGIDDAIAKAAELAKVSNDYKTRSYPSAPSFIDQLLNTLQSGNGNYLDEQLKANLGEYYEPVMMVKNFSNLHPLQARMPYYLNIK
ncbi:MAG: signal peptide peptidase SppA [Prevotella sp.]